MGTDGDGLKEMRGDDSMMEYIRRPDSGLELMGVGEDGKSQQWTRGDRKRQ